MAPLHPMLFLFIYVCCWIPPPILVPEEQSLNQLVMVFVTKDKHLSSSMSLYDCISLIVIINSVGYVQGVCKIMEEIGCFIPASSVFECLKWCYAKHEYDKASYHRRMGNKQWCRETKWESIKASLHYHKNDISHGFKYSHPQHGWQWWMIQLSWSEKSID